MPLNLKLIRRITLPLILIIIVIYFFFISNIFIDHVQSATTPCDFDVILTIDKSRSSGMIQNGRPRVEWAKEAAISFVNTIKNVPTSMKGQVRIGVVVFGGEYQHPGNTKLIQPLTHNYSDVISNINTIQTTTAYNTCIDCGLRMANNELNGKKITDVPQYVILLSDGAGNQTYNMTGVPYVSVEVARLASTASANAGRTQGIEYYAVGYGSNTEYDGQTLLEIAGSSTRVKYNPDPTDWANTFINLALGLFNCAPSSTPTPTIYVPPTRTPTPTPILPAADIQARVHTLATGETYSCSSLPENYTTASYNLTPGNVNRTSYGATYARWPNVAYNTSYTLDPIMSSIPGYTLIDACLFAKVEGSTVPQFKMQTLTGSINTNTNDRGLIWEVIVGPPQKWWQTGGGDVYANSYITSKLPVTELLSKNIGGDTSGVVTYGNSISLSGEDDELTHVSPTNWLVKTTYPSENNKVNYQYVRSLVDDKINTTPPLITNIPDNTEAGEFYYEYSNSQTVSQVILVRPNQKFIIFVNGTLTITQKIHIAPGGFLAFIVKGPIIIDPSLGFGSGYVKADTLVDAQLDGLYLTDDTFSTGISNKQLTGKGMFIASSFMLQRSLDAVNRQYPAQVFIYDPELLFTMPVSIMTSKVKWSEALPQTITTP